jgi:ferritin-like metal-binding protein YciE
MSIESLADLYVEELKDLYSAENQILKALPKMIDAATHPELKKAFSDHLAQTKIHVERLETICEELGVSPTGKKCKGMEGVIADGAGLIEDEPESNVLDAGLASAAQHVEHYEMAGYGSVRTWAEQLGYGSHVKVLQQTLDEEKSADKLLTQIAERSLNIDAVVGDTVEEGLADVSSRAQRSASKATKSQTSRHRGSEDAAESR